MTGYKNNSLKSKKFHSNIFHLLSSYDLYNTTAKNELTIIFHFIVNNCFTYIYKLPLAFLLEIITIICESPLNWVFLCKYVRLIDLQK